jgi:hypothetical protein
MLNQPTIEKLHSMKSRSLPGVGAVVHEACLPVPVL